LALAPSPQPKATESVRVHDSTLDAVHGQILRSEMLLQVALEKKARFGEFLAAKVEAQHAASEEQRATKASKDAVKLQLEAVVHEGDIQVEEKLAAAKATAAAANAAGWAAEEKARAEQKSAAGKGAMMIETHGMRRHGQSLVQEGLMEPVGANNCSSRCVTAPWTCAWECVLQTSDKSAPPGSAIDMETGTGTGPGSGENAKIGAVKRMGSFLHNMWECGFSKAARAKTSTFKAWQTCVIGASAASTKTQQRLPQQLSQRPWQHLELLASTGGPGDAAVEPSKMATIMAGLSRFLHALWACGFTTLVSTFVKWQACVDDKIKLKQQGAQSQHQVTAGQMRELGGFIKAMWSCGFCKDAEKQMADFKQWQECVKSVEKGGWLDLAPGMKPTTITFQANGRQHSHRIDAG